MKQFNYPVQSKTFPHSLAQNSSSKIPFLEKGNSSSHPAPASLRDHIHPSAVSNFMEDVFSRRPQDLSDFSHPHTLLLVRGSFFSCFLVPASPSSRAFSSILFLFLSFPTVMQLCVVHVRLPQWF
jgi:hypothetical protein